MRDELTNQQELHRKAFELTLALYRVTDFFPQGEALKRQLREKANEIFGGVTEYGYADGRERGTRALLAKVETIKGYLDVARSMRFVKQINLTILEREYEFLERLLKGELRYIQSGARADHEHAPVDSAGLFRDPAPGEESYNERKENSPPAGEMTRRAAPIQKSSIKDAPRPDGVTETSVTARQKKILDHVARTSQTKLSDLYALLPDVSSKTIQRELHDLVQKAVLKKSGKKRWTVYSLK